MKVELSDQDGVRILEPHKFRDVRGTLTKHFDSIVFSGLGCSHVWQQHIISTTEKAFTLRGLHIQMPPYTEAKLISAIAGQMLWVIVDLRKGSPNFRNWSSVILDGESSAGLLVPRGFAHGCMSLSDDVTLTILADNAYDSDHGVGIRWDDPDIGIDWPLPPGVKPLLSDEHANCMSFAEQIERLERVE